MRHASLRLETYLGHIITAAEKIELHVASTNFERFVHDEILQLALQKLLKIIGEASRQIAIRFPAFAVQHPEFPFDQTYWTRNRLIHGYFDVDAAILWATAKEDIPSIKQLAKQLLLDQNNFPLQDAE